MFDVNALIPKFSNEQLEKYRVASSTIDWDADDGSIECYGALCGSEHPVTGLKFPGKNAGKKNSNYGKHGIDAHGSGKRSETVCKNITQALLNYNSELNKNGINHYLVGTTRSTETRQRMSECKMGDKHPSKNPNNYTKCPHCSKGSMNKGSMSRWHFDNCKEKKNV